MRACPFGAVMERSEVLPVQTLAEAVRLVEAVEKSGKIYAYGENYCYFPATLEMKRLYRKGVLGEFEYGEGEYAPDCDKETVFGLMLNKIVRKLKQIN